MADMHMTICGVKVASIETYSEVITTITQQTRVVYFDSNGNEIKSEIHSGFTHTHRHSHTNVTE